MSLSGIRDMSLIDDPPEGRMPIKTYVKEYDDELVREVDPARAGPGRPGLLPAQPGREHLAHRREAAPPGPAAPRWSSRTARCTRTTWKTSWSRFDDNEFDILVCTTIVESGLDIPNVNTIIVDNADKLGLAQLYQLRGRVGRSNRQGYAYLLYRKDKVLTEVAEKRLARPARVLRPRLRLQSRPARPGNPRRGQPAGRGAVAARSPPSASTCTRSCCRRRSTS